MPDNLIFDAFVAGALGFISPSVLPLIPGYLAFVLGVHGVSVAAKRQVILGSLFFVLGFSLVFVSLGASATVAGQLMLQQSTLFRQIAGIVLIVVGLHTIGVFKVRSLLNDTRGEVTSKPAAMMVAVVVGSAFAFGWTPHIGPTLAAIFAAAAQPQSVNQGMALLSIYSLGLAIPFLLAALAIHELFVAFSKIRRHDHKIAIVSGLLMIATGVLIFQ